MKNLIIILIAFVISSNVYAEEKIVTLDEFMIENKLDQPAALYYFISRCGGLYSYYAVLTQPKAPETSKNYIGLVTKLAVLGAKLRMQDNIEAEKAQKDIFSNIKDTTQLYSDHSKKHYTRTGSYISDEIKSDTMHCQKFSELYLE